MSGIVAHKGWRSAVIPTTQNPSGSKKFGDMLRTVREAKGLSQVQLAERMGYHHAHISRVELAQRRPGFGFVEGLSEVMDLSERERDTLVVLAGFVPERMQNRILEMVSNE